MPAVSWAARLWLALSCGLRVLLDGAFASRVWAVRSSMPALPPRVSEPPRDEPAPAAKPGRPPVESALALLSLFQREGRLVDFLEQDIDDFDDSDVGAAARVVQQGCRRALRDRADVRPVRDDEEGSEVEVERGYAPSEVKLTGAVSGAPPYRGVLRHRGWRILDLSLPSAVDGHDASVVAPAEIEL